MLRANPGSLSHFLTPAFQGDGTRGRRILTDLQIHSHPTRLHEPIASLFVERVAIVRSVLRITEGQNHKEQEDYTHMLHPLRKMRKLRPRDSHKQAMRSQCLSSLIPPASSHKASDQTHPDPPALRPSLSSGCLNSIICPIPPLP